MVSKSFFWKNLGKLKIYFCGNIIIRTFKIKKIIIKIRF